MAATLLCLVKIGVIIMYHNKIPGDQRNRTAHYMIKASNYDAHENYGPIICDTKEYPWVYIWFVIDAETT